jgi:mannosyltransferase
MAKLPINPKLALLLIFVFSAAIRFIGLGEKQLWVDEIIQAVHSTPDTLEEILKGVAGDRGSAPLDYLVQHYTMKALGSRDEFSARFHAAVFGSISVLVVYFIGWNLFRSRNPALLSSALWGIYPFHHYYSQEARPYSLFALLALCLFLLYQKLRKEFSWTLIALMSLTAVASFYAHPYTALLLMALFCIELFQPSDNHPSLLRRKRLWTLAGVSALSALAFVPWIIFSFHNAHGEDNAWFGWRLASDAIKAFGGGSYPLSLMLLAIAFVGAIRMKKEKSDSLIQLSAWLLIPIPVTIAILHWRTYFFNARQWIFITPAIIFFVAYGFNHLFSCYRKQAVAIFAIYFCICFTVISLHFTDNKRMDFKGVSAYLKQHVESSDRIIAPNIGLILSYYFPEIRRYEQAGYDISPSNQGRLFLVDSESAWETDQQKMEQLQKELPRTEQQLFQGIKLSVLSLQTSQP